MVYVITVAFCPAAQLARALMRFSNMYGCQRYQHFIVQGHYPINKKKNNRDIEMIVDAHNKARLLDPGENLGSAQSQWWALNQIGLNINDYWINFDPDSDCRDAFWAPRMEAVLDNDPNCVLISCRAPLIERLIEKRRQVWEWKEITVNQTVHYGVLKEPTPFNLSMWRYSYLKELGGIPQVGKHWGEVEGPFHFCAQRDGKYHAYLRDFFENEDGKLMQDRQLLEYKDKYMRTVGEGRFVGLFKEYVDWKYPELLAMDTMIADDTVFQ